MMKGARLKESAQIPCRRIAVVRVHGLFVPDFSPIVWRIAFIHAITMRPP